MFKKNFEVIVEHDLDKMMGMIKRIESYGGKLYEVNDEVTYITLKYRATYKAADKIMEGQEKLNAKKCVFRYLNKKDRERKMTTC